MRFTSNNPFQSSTKGATHIASRHNQSVMAKPSFTTFCSQRPSLGACSVDIPKAGGISSSVPRRRNIHLS